MKQRTSYAEWICFVAGGLAGASVALLWAPWAGGHTRNLLGRRLRDAVNAAGDLEEAQEPVSAVADQTRLRETPLG
jgi:gas vesicle protein